MRPAAEAARPFAGGTPAAGAGWAADDDAALIHAFRAGDVAGFERVFRRHSHRLQVFCRHRLGPGAPAEDIVQEAFLRLLSAVDRVDDGFNVGSWLNRVVYNLCVDEVRRLRRQAPVTSEEGVEAIVLGLPDPDRARQPEAAQEMTRLRELIGRTMDSLPPRQHAAFVLHELRGLSCRHVAERLGLTEAAAETLLVRARRRFRREFRRLDDAGA
jgi:RNA polymerase sigma-70 factor (ECF subfamily)